MYTRGKLHGIIHQLRISELAKESGATTDLIRYLEAKGFIKPEMLMLRKRKVRNYSEDQVQLVKLIVQHIEKGFKHDTAYKKAIDQINNPRLV